MGGTWWTVEGVLKSQIENALEEMMGRGRWRGERRLKSQIEDAGEERMRRGCGELRMG